MRRRGMAEASIAAALITENEVRCRPPLAEADVLRIAKSIGRYSPEPSSEPTTFVNSLPELLQRASSVDEPRWLVDGLIPGDGTVLVHSQPREYKTLAAQALLISMTTGRPAFGLERLQVGDPSPLGTSQKRMAGGGSRIASGNSCAGTASSAHPNCSTFPPAKASVWT